MQGDPLDDIPSFCIVSQADRALAWERNPPKPYALQEEQREVMRLRKEEDRAKAYERIEKLKAKREKSPAAPPVDLTNMRWDSRRNKWVPKL